MNKENKIVLIVAGVAVAGYFIVSRMRQNTAKAEAAKEIEKADNGETGATWYNPLTWF